MVYDLRWHEKAVEELKAIDKKIAKGLIDRVKEYLIREPRTLGKSLKGMFQGLYRYRYGDWRVIYAIDEQAPAALILRVGNRRTVYKKPIKDNPSG